jgi:hypothetical protein
MNIALPDSAWLRSLCGSFPPRLRSPCSSLPTRCRTRASASRLAHAPVLLPAHGQPCSEPPMQLSGSDGLLYVYHFESSSPATFPVRSALLK